MKAKSLHDQVTDMRTNGVHRVATSPVKTFMRELCQRELAARMKCDTYEQALAVYERMAKSQQGELL